MREYNDSDRLHGGWQEAQDQEKGSSSSTSRTSIQVGAVSRRRRKRSRSESNIGPSRSMQPSTKATAAAAVAAIPSLDDSALTFLDNNGDFLEDRNRVALSSVPILLARRQLGLKRQSSGRQHIRSWQNQIIIHPVNKPGHSRRQWRSYAARSIPFTQLGTPASDAVLALDRQGSYVLCLGTKDIRNAPLALALRFFGIPSPSAVATQQGSRESSRVATSGVASTTPLLQTTPLLFDILDESHEEAIFSFRRGISPAITPVKILMSNDWKMGVALIQPSNAWREEGPIGTIVLFSSPAGRSRRDSMTSTVFQCTNVNFGADLSFSHRNLLWRVEGLPMDVVSENADISSTDPSSSVPFLNLPGYLFLNDENDGFRLTWSLENWNLDDACLTCDSTKVQECPMTRGGVDPTTAILSSETTWERCDADLLSGERIIPVTGKPSGVRIVHESFLHIDVLLSDILSRRKGISGERKPKEYVYNLISVTNSGRIAQLIITFIRTQKPGSLGVFVKVDLHLGRYQELSWMKNTSTRDPVALRKWCNALALNQRMKDLRIGPYTVTCRNRAIDWSKLSVEMSFDPDEDDDFCPSFWEEYVESGEAIATRKPPKFVSLSAIYPDCDLITNNAIIDCVPVNFLGGKDSPSQLTYV